MAGGLVSENEIEKNGFCASRAMVIDGKVLLFYQSYGNFPADKKLHAISEVEINFKHNLDNHIFSPSGCWNNGRAIDDDMLILENRILMYYVTRNPDGKVHKLGICGALVGSDLKASCWQQLYYGSTVYPRKRNYIEAPAAYEHAGKIYICSWRQL